jgi:hypothetical protein
MQLFQVLTDVFDEQGLSEDYDHFLMTYHPGEACHIADIPTETTISELG